MPQFVDTAIVSLRSVLRSCDAALAAITAVLDFFGIRNLDASVAAQPPRPSRRTIGSN